MAWLLVVFVVFAVVFVVFAERSWIDVVRGGAWSKFCQGEQGKIVKICSRLGIAARDGDGTIPQYSKVQVPRYRYIFFTVPG